MRKYIILLLSLLASNFMMAQFAKPQNLPGYDNKIVHWGFTFGIDKFDFFMEKSTSFAFADTANNLYGIVHKWMPGGHLGPIVELRLDRYFKLRFLVTLTFQQRDLLYYFNHGKDVLDIAIPSTFIQTPVLLKFNGARRGNVRPYVIAGMAPTFDIASKKHLSPDRPHVYLNRFDMCAEVGTGISWFLPYFKLATELKFGRGFFNVLQPDGTLYTKYINALYSYYVMFSFHFEG